MALSVKVGTFQKSTGGAPASQAITGVGFVPKALMLFTSGVTALNSVTAHYLLAIGFTAGSSNSGSMGTSGKDAVATTVDAQRAAAKALTIHRYDNVLLAECDLTSFDSDGFTLNWTTNDANAYYVGYLALGGTDLTGAKVVQWSDPASTGDKAVTGVGFKPTVIFDIANATTTAPPVTSTFSDFSFGIADGGGAHQSVAFRCHNAVASLNARSATSYGVFTSGPNGNVATWFEITRFKSMDSDGFTSYAETTLSGRNHYSLCLGGIGVATAPAFKPTGAAPASHSVSLFRAILPQAAILVGDQKIYHSGSGPSTPMYFGLGVSDGTNSACLAISENYSATSLAKSLMRNDKWFMKVANDTGTQNAVADTPSFSNNTVTTSWSTNDAVEDTQGWVAFGGATAVNPSSGMSRAAVVNHR